MYKNAYVKYLFYEAKIYSTLIFFKYLNCIIIKTNNEFIFMIKKIVIL